MLAECWVQLRSANYYVKIKTMPNLFIKGNDGQFTRKLPNAPLGIFGGEVSIGGTSATPSARNLNAVSTSGAVVNQPQPRVFPPATPLPTAPIPSPYTPPVAPQAPTPQVNNPYDAFNLLLQESLKAAQKIDSTDLLKQQRALQRTSLERSRGTGVTPPTAEELKFLSPAQQESMRNASVSALEPDIDEISYQLKKNEQERKNLIEQIQLAQKGATELGDRNLKERTLEETIRKNKADEKTSGLLGGLTAAQINATVNNIAGQFDAEQTVKDFNTANSSINTLRSIGVKTKSPTDDMAFIYAFAKIMDPNSVVREGEYKTVQDYAQSLVQRYATGVDRVVDNSNFLTEDAKTKMLSTLEGKVNSLKKSYDNVAKEYQRQINDAYSGKPRQITNYGGVETPQSGGTIVEYQGKQYSVDASGEMIPI